MKITVFGANGNMGRRIVTEAISRGHQVTAVGRTESGSKIPGVAQYRVGDAGKLEDVIKLSTGQDIVITATRPQAGNEDELIQTTKNLLQGLTQTKTRLLISGGAGGLTVPGSQTLALNNSKYVGAGWFDIAQACTQQLEVCKQDAQANWTYLCPAAMLAAGERTGKFRLGGHELLLDEAGNSAISMEDMAIALVDEAEQAKHPRDYFTLAY